MKPLNIMIDAGMLQFGINKTKNRRGIFFVTYNLINELINRKDIRLCFYINKTPGDKLKKFIIKTWPDYNCVFFEYKPLFLFNLYKRFEKTKIISSFLSCFINYQKKKQTDYRNRFLSENNCDLFFSTYYKIPGIFSNCSLKKFTIVHDLIPIVISDSVSKDSVAKFKNLMNSFNYNDFYFTVSDYTRNDLIKYVPQINPNHVFPSYISCSESVKSTSLTESLKKKYNIPPEKKYVFSLFASEKRKNLERNIKTFISFVKKNDLNDIVYVVGGSTEGYKYDLNDGYDLTNIIFTGYIPDEDLCALYSGAEFFVFTSMYEGFGLPVLEAMRCGCPVISSNSSSLPEVIGDAGILIDWDSDEQHVSAYEKYYFDKEYREESIKKGLIQAQMFSWKKTVDFMLKKMRENI